MPKAYAVVTYRSVSDLEKLAAYAELALPAVKPFGARVLARCNAVVAREHGLKERTVVTEFPSLEKATAAYDSPAYAEALKALGDGAVRDFRIVEGVEFGAIHPEPQLLQGSRVDGEVRCKATLLRRSKRLSEQKPRHCST